MARSAAFARGGQRHLQRTQRSGTRARHRLGGISSLRLGSKSPRNPIIPRPDLAAVFRVKPAERSVASSCLDSIPPKLFIHAMAESWDPELLSAILKSSAPGLDKASHDPAFPLLSPAAADNIRTTSPSSTAGCVLRIFQNLLDHDESVQAAADNLGSLISRHCTEDSEDATLLWGAICQRAETWPAAKTSMLCDLVVELAKLSYALPAYPYDTDEPVQGTSSLSELPGFGQELVGRMQGQTKCP